MSFEDKCIMNILHICVTSKWFNIDNKIVDHRP
ncbi:tryptophanase leader peptide [Escherichia coli O111:H11 str. CVM9545]|nr:tryptophanase leader peptide [Escherichia coli APEC O78]EDU63189.1 tryptophanase leader peptide [Escherichia coli 53638]EIK99973.1 tryptophanase leader peptide [Escherichia coli O103:H25 str. CVM9340]EIL01385.1 tryptophanase leader peptide [Escherichia coli O103:H2 str. CVM9450]EIL16172.1 tryptophanase leader peptide [Escherichia coli O111:H11 str. CVM9534]EIL18885.1 tryptophanase leader peptide [Escherichia coli O111:H8 str. CVM9574]EIL20503.1 tryptophanase leader peptide [Escherichia col